MGLRVIVLLTVGITVWSANAETYWYSYEADDGKLPENSGWTRYTGFGGAQRSIANGVLTYDSLGDINIWDFNELSRPGHIDPRDADELLLMEWRLRVRKVDGREDPGVGVNGDEAWSVGFGFAEDRLFSVFEGYTEIPIEPGVYHDYRLISSDMRAYELWIDGSLARHGLFSQRVSTSRIVWGEGVQGAASLHDWDYFRAGVVLIPEPSSSCLLVAGLCAVRCVARTGRHFVKGDFQ